jgi:DNA-binding transcriptional ArsR family regulator
MRTKTITLCAFNRFGTLTPRAAGDPSVMCAYRPPPQHLTKRFSMLSGAVSALADDQLDAVFTALAHPTRRAVVAALTDGEASVTELAEPFGVSLPAMVKHLRVLERAGLLEHQKDGRVRHCRLVAAPMRFAEEWLSSYRVFWETRLDALTEHLKSNREVVTGERDLESEREVT